jgi:hypothetical protein
MKGWYRLSRIAALSLCFVLAASLAVFPEQEPAGLHLDSDGKKIHLSDSDVEPEHIRLPGADSVTIPNPLDERPCTATAAMLPMTSPRRSGPVDAGSFPLCESWLRSQTVLRI